MIVQKHLRPSKAMRVCLCMVLLIVSKAGKGQNDFPPPAPIVPQLMGMPMSSQIVVLGGAFDGLNGHIYATDGKQQRQFRMIGDNTAAVEALKEKQAAMLAQELELHATIGALQDDLKHKDTDRWSQIWIELASLGGCSGSVYYQVQQHKRKRKSSDEEDS